MSTRAPHTKKLQRHRERRFFFSGRECERPVRAGYRSGACEYLGLATARRRRERETYAQISAFCWIILEVGEKSSRNIGCVWRNSSYLPSQKPAIVQDGMLSLHRVQHALWKEKECPLWMWKMLKWKIQWQTTSDEWQVTSEKRINVENAHTAFNRKHVWPSDYRSRPRYWTRGNLSG